MAEETSPLAGAQQPTPKAFGFKVLNHLIVAKDSTEKLYIKISNVNILPQPNPKDLKCDAIFGEKGKVDSDPLEDLYKKEKAFFKECHVPVQEGGEGFVELKHPKNLEKKSTRSCERLACRLRFYTKGLLKSKEFADAVFDIPTDEYIVRVNPAGTIQVKVMRIIEPKDVSELEQQLLRTLKDNVVSGYHEDFHQLIKGGLELCSSNQNKLETLCRPALEGADGQGGSAKYSAIVLLRELRSKPVDWQPSAEEAEQEGLPHLAPISTEIAQHIEMEVMRRLQEMGVGPDSPNLAETTELVRSEVKQCYGLSPETQVSG